MSKSLEFARRFSGTAATIERSFGRHYGLVGQGALLSLGFQAVGFLDKLGENRADPVMFRRYLNADYLGLRACDYNSISDRKGNPNVGGREWSPSYKDRKTRLSGRQYDSFHRNAQLVYETSALDVGRGRDMVMQQTMHLNAQRFKGIEAMDPMDGVPAVFAAPHIAALALGTTGLMARAEGKGSPISVVYEHFARDIQLLNNDPNAASVEYMSDWLAQELIYVSNELCSFEPTARESGRAFYLLDSNDLTQMGTAVQQIGAVNYLTAARERNPELASLMVSVACCIGGMLRVGQQRYKDEDVVVDRLGAQWGLGVELAKIDPAQLRVDPVRWQQAVETLVKDVPG